MRFFDYLLDFVNEIFSVCDNNHLAILGTCLWSTLKRECVKSIPKATFMFENSDRALSLRVQVFWDIALCC